MITKKEILETMYDKESVEAIKNKLFSNECVWADEKTGWNEEMDAYRVGTAYGWEILLKKIDYASVGVVKIDMTKKVTKK